MVTLQLLDMEDEKFQRYARENARRRHNFIPFIMNLLQVSLWSNSCRASSLQVDTRLLCRVLQRSRSLLPSSSPRSEKRKLARQQPKVLPNHETCMCDAIVFVFILNELVLLQSGIFVAHEMNASSR